MATFLTKLNDIDVPPTLVWPLKFCLFSSVATYVASILTANVSQVDRVWTFLPTIYTAYFALLPFWSRAPLFPIAPYTPGDVSVHVAAEYSPRALVMLALVNLWMFRLSYNTYRRGLFSLQDEDYRWAVLRKQLPPWLFQIVNLTFISIIQNILLLLLGIPTHAAAVGPHEPLTYSDHGLASLALIILALEFTSDNQQYAYQTYKRSGILEGQVGTYDAAQQWPGARLAWTKEDAQRGFVTRGLWAWSRHPNFACEQTFWWIITMFPLASPSSTFIPDLIKTYKTAILFHSPLSDFMVITPLIPAIALSALFFSSTMYTEDITLSKYREAYELYQERVATFSPLTTILQAAILRLSGRLATVNKAVWGGKVE